jgi:hypothetical protein
MVRVKILDAIQLQRMQRAREKIQKAIKNDARCANKKLRMSSKKEAQIKEAQKTQDVPFDVQSWRSCAS